MAEFGWAYVGGSNALTGAAGPTGSVLLKKGDTEITGSPNLIFDTGSFQLQLQGTLSASSAITASNLNLYGVSAGTPPNTSSYLAIDSNFNLVLTSAAGVGGSGVIGEAEDGDYTDGLYTDFTPTTPIGTAIDRFNEILKILSPPLTPNVQSINYDQTDGISAKLSFDDTYPITDYTSSATDAGFDAVTRNNVYEADVSGSNYRLGIYNNQDITGTINHDVLRNEINTNVVYTADAFGQANNGVLKLELNGTIIHSVDLSSFVGAGDPGTGSAQSLTGDSGFVEVSVTASSFDGNGSEWVQYQYRTAKYKIAAAEQKKGWNYLRIIHTIGSTEHDSNYIEWINDPDGAGAALSISNSRIEDITKEGNVYLSGVNYNTQLTASYKADISNIYRNVFPTGTPISFVSTNATTPSAQSVPDLLVSEDETKVLGVTASFNLLGNLYPSQTIGLGTSVTHPLKSNLVNQGSATATGFLIFDNTPPTTTNLIETFINEDYRIISGSYPLQAMVSLVNWDSRTHLTSSGLSGYNDGLVQIGTQQYNGRLYSPVASDLPNSGDFSALANGEAGNPDYSSETGTRTYFRKIQNTSGVTKYDMEITTTKAGTTFNNSVLALDNAHFFIKIPQATGWMDISQNFSYGNISDGDGALISGASNDTDSGNNTHHITFGTASVAANDYVVIKMEADASWRGYLAQLQFTFGASTETAATPQVLSDIDANNIGSAAKLSFGSSNTIADYSSVLGSGLGSMTNVDTNGTYGEGGDRRGIFTFTPIIAGEINDAIPGDGGSDYPAKAFYNAYSGSLILEVNGTEVHSVDLESTLSGISSFNSNGSGLNISAVSFSTTSDSIPDYNKPYRTGTYQVDEDDQNVGWNYARLIHRTSGDVVTNYVEWVIDPSGSIDDATVSTPLLTDFNHTDIYYQSGIGYFASNPSASFSFSGSNLYRNVYQIGDSISFPTLNSASINSITGSGTGLTTLTTTNSAMEMPALDNSAGCELTDLIVTSSISYNGPSTSISGGLNLFTAYNVGISGRALHPLKASPTTSTATKNAFMVYSGSIGSTVEASDEYFNTEDYRIVSGNYTTQASLTQSANAWNPSTAMNNGGTHDDGLVTVNGYLISPKQIGVAGDTGNSNLQAPSGNPDYSTLSNGTRTLYRYFFNDTVNDRSSVTITLYGSGSLVKQATPLGANGNFYVEAKIPGKTAWLDVGTAYTSNNPLVDGAGALDGAAPGNPAIDISTGGTSVVCNFNGESLLGGANDEHFAIKISADEDWVGYLSRIRIQYS